MGERILDQRHKEMQLIILSKEQTNGKGAVDYLTVQPYRSYMILCS